jgi:membrane protein
MSLRDHKIFKNLWLALKQFFKEDGLDKSSILAYYSIFSSLFLLTFFTYLFTKFLDDPEITFKGIYPFSHDFFAAIAPDIIKRASDIASRLKEVGMLGILFSFMLGFLVIRKIVQFVNSMFHVDMRTRHWERHFLARRLREFSLIFIIGILLVLTFLATGFISVLSTLFYQNQFIAEYISPQFIEFVDHFLILNVVPFLVTFLFFFVLYKWIPEKIVYKKSAFISALICTILWELAKRGYTQYMLKISILGKIKGPIIGIIIFGFWMELSMGIMLYGAKLTALLDIEKEAHDELKKH